MTNDLNPIKSTDEVALQYPGEVVAIVGGRVIAHNKDYAEVYKEMRKKGVKGAVVTRISNK